MKLTYIRPMDGSDNWSGISVILEEGETLGNLFGPVEATVPLDPANTEYAAIQTQELVIDEPAPYQPPVPQTADMVAFWQHLGMTGEVTETEAEDMIVAKTLPASWTAAIKTLPTADQFPVRTYLRGQASYERQNSNIVKLIPALGWDDAKADQVWTEANSLSFSA